MVRRCQLAVMMLKAMRLVRHVLEVHSRAAFSASSRTPGDPVVLQLP
jgi:hypothetical protein